MAGHVATLDATPLSVVDPGLAWRLARHGLLWRVYGRSAEPWPLQRALRLYGRPRWHHRRGRTSPLSAGCRKAVRRAKTPKDENHPGEPARSKKQINQTCDNDADPAHEQKSSES